MAAATCDQISELDSDIEIWKKTAFSLRTLLKKIDIDNTESVIIIELISWIVGEVNRLEAQKQILLDQFCNI